MNGVALKPKTKPVIGRNNSNLRDMTFGSHLRQWRTYVQNLKRDQSSLQRWEELKTGISKSSSQELSLEAVKSGHLRLGPFRILLFNSWKRLNTTFYIVEAHHPYILRKICDRLGGTEILMNHSLATIIQQQVAPPLPQHQQDIPKLALTTIAIGGWEHFPSWHHHYQSDIPNAEFLIYINATRAPQPLIEFAKHHQNIHLIPWNFPYKKHKNHILRSHQTGHAQPSSIADAKFRALKLGCTHLLPVDFDEFIYPATRVNQYLTKKPTYFLSFFAKNNLNDFGITESTQIANTEDSLFHPKGISGFSDMHHNHALGKCISPIQWNCDIPNIHCAAVASMANLTVPEDTVMLHFLEQEGTRKYPIQIQFSPLHAVNLRKVVSEHRRNSDSVTSQHATVEPLYFFRA